MSLSPCVPPASVLRPPRAGEPVESIYRRTRAFGMDLSQTKRTTIERPAAPPGLDPNPQRVVPSGESAREAAAGTLGSISGFPQLLRPKARIRRPFVASILRVLAPADGLPGPHRRIRARYSDFGYLLVWGYIADLSMVPRLRRGRLASRALRTPFISCAVKKEFYWRLTERSQPEREKMNRSVRVE